MVPTNYDFILNEKDLNLSADEIVLFFKSCQESGVFEKDGEPE